MKNSEILHKIKGKLIVSCQALEEEPLHGSNFMAKMALATKLGGVATIRANSVEDIAAIKKDYDDSEIYITPTLEEVESLNELGR